MFGWITENKYKIRNSGDHVNWYKETKTFLKKYYAENCCDIEICEFEGINRVIEIKAKDGSSNKYCIYGHKDVQQAQWQPGINKINMLNNTLPEDWNLMCVHADPEMKNNVDIYIIGWEKLNQYIAEYEKFQKALYIDDEKTEFLFGKTDNDNRRTYDIHKRAMTYVPEGELKHLGAKDLWEHFE